MQARFDEVRAQVHGHLANRINALPSGELRDAMAYATVGGKRLRAFLAFEGARLHGVGDTSILPVAAAVEALHAYSLVHDDLPAMDNDDLRRGMPTCHLQWSEATAVLAGDALQALAFEFLTSDAIGEADARLRLIAGFAASAGASGMVWGQALDIAAEQAPTPLDLKAIKKMQGAKTGALIRFATTSGAVIADADPEPLDSYARSLGLAFQIADDILDETGSEDATGKRVGKDKAAGKATFVSLLGLEGARGEARRLVEAAQAALDPYGAPADTLREIAKFAIERNT